VDVEAVGNLMAQLRALFHVARYRFVAGFSA
jgi:hypothetical protein